MMRGHTVAAQGLPTAIVKAIESGRATGKFNLVDKGLQDSQLPPELWDENLPVSGPQAARFWEVSEPTVLNLSRNCLTHLPPQVCSWPSLTQIDVSHNQIAAVPDSLIALGSLGSLVVNNNQMQVLPAVPSSLVILHAQHNKLVALPDSLAGCRGLAHLDASHNQLQQIQPQLTQLPPDLRGLSKLKVLDVQHNRLQALPPTIAACQSLLELHAGHNQLQRLPHELSACSELRHLSVRDNRISDLPTELCSLQLSVLDLQNCDLASLPPELGLMTTLRGLLLEGNALRTMRRLISGPVSATLKYLRSRLPEEDPGSSCTQPVRSGNVFGFDAQQVAADMAHKLAISNNTAAQGRGSSYPPAHSATYGGGAQPPGMVLATPGHDPWQQQASVAPAAHGYQQQGGVQGRQAVVGGREAVAGGREAVVGGREAVVGGREAAAGPAGGPAGGAPPGGQAGAAAGAGRARGPELVLAASGLTGIPDQVWAALPCLHKLDLSSNQLHHVPPEGLLHAQELRTLLLNRLPITSWPLPPAPGCLPCLHTLSLAGCARIACIPPGALASCEASLTSLDLSGVPAAGQLPPGTLARLERLEVLDLSQTGLRCFPAEVLQPTLCLRTLRLANNKISSIPEQVCQLSRLAELHLANNELTSLPPSLGLLADSLRALTVEGNPVRTIRRPILDKGTAAILAYLKDRIPAA